MKAYDVMSVDIVAAKEDAKAIEISTRMVLEGYNGMPIIDDRGVVIGIVTTLDILKAIKDNKNLDELSAKDIMTRHPATLSQEATTDEIIDIMHRKGIDMIPIVSGEEEEGRLIGVVSRQDILKERLNERFVSIGKI
ncbi:MAG: CBS domain-containing protein [Nitrososphaeraceae archaeon]